MFAETSILSTKLETISSNYVKFESAVKCKWFIKNQWLVHPLNASYHGLWAKTAYIFLVSARLLSKLGWKQNFVMILYKEDWFYETIIIYEKPTSSYTTETWKKNCQSQFSG